jgi:hypothetical protein
MLAPASYCVNTSSLNACYEHTIHRFAAPLNSPWRMVCAEGRCPRVALRRSLMPALLPEGDEFPMNFVPFRALFSANFREYLY